MLISLAMHVNNMSNARAKTTTRKKVKKRCEELHIKIEQRQLRCLNNEQKMETVN